MNISISAPFQWTAVERSVQQFHLFVKETGFGSVCHSQWEFRYTTEMPDERRRGPTNHRHRLDHASINRIHYSDVILGAMSSQFTSLTIVHSTVYSGADQKKHQRSASLAFLWGIHRWPVNSPHKWPLTRKMFPLMTSSWAGIHWSSGNVLINKIYVLTSNKTVSVVSLWSHILLAWINCIAVYQYISAYGLLWLKPAFCAWWICIQMHVQIAFLWYAILLNYLFLQRTQLVSATKWPEFRLKFHWSFFSYGLIWQ